MGKILKDYGNINNLFTEDFFKKYSEKLKDYDKNSNILALVNDNDEIVDFVVFKKNEFFKNVEPISHNENIPLNDLTNLISSLKYGVDVLVPINEGEDFYIVNPTDLSLLLFSNLGFSNMDKTLYKPFSIIFPKLKELGVINLFQRGYKNDEKLSLKLMLFSDDAFICSLQYSIRRYQDYLLLISNDTTDFDFVNKRENDLFEKSIIPLIVVQNDVVVRVNSAYLNLFGFKKEDIINKPYNYFSKKSLKMSLEERKDVMAKIMSHDLFYYEDTDTFFNSKNEKVFVNSIIFPIRYKGHHAAQISLIDITKTKKAEEDSLLLKEALDTVQNVTKIAYYNYRRPTGVFWTDQICDILSSNMESMSNDMSVLINDLSQEKQDELIDKMGRAFVNQSSFFTTTSVKDSQGNIKYLDIYGKVTKENGYSFVIGYVQDITDSVLYEKNLKDANEKLESLVEEKNILLKEVHHRVKNNLQIILSLLKLDARFKPNDPQNILESTQNRIFAMSLIHEKIYRSSDLAHVNMKDYIESEIDYLFKLYNVSNIKVNYDLENIDLDMNVAIPLGLIINEMIHNILKYAFPDGNGGNINISIESEEGNVTFILADDGVGLPEDLDIYNTTSLGFTVINGLVYQLEGVFTKLDQSGAAFKIEFKI